MTAIQRVGILGAGTMGRGIATVIAQAGMDALLCEKDLPTAEAAVAQLSADLDYEISRWALTSADKRALLKKISVTTDLAQIAGLDR
jgi:3-hydroxybutyryl-CoA dehydrogenase